MLRVLPLTNQGYATCNNVICWKAGSILGGKTRNIAIFAAMLQNKLHVPVAGFVVAQRTWGNLFGFLVYDGLPRDVAKKDVEQDISTAHFSSGGRLKLDSAALKAHFPSSGW